MSLFDLILIVIIAGFAVAGFWLGLIHTAGSLLGTVVSLYVASRYYEPVANWIIGFTGWSGNITRVVVFIISFLIIGRLVGLLFWFAQKILHLVTLLPFITSLNRILGFIFGAAEGVIVVGVAVYFIARFPLSPDFMQALANSSVAAFASSVAALLWPLVPQALQALQSSVDYVEHIVRSS
jgi:membrane protein required for colicin V production